MKLKSLSLANFRGFDQIDIEFEPDVTVIAGVNGVGKSAILQAIAIIMTYNLGLLAQSKEKNAKLELSDVLIDKEKLNIASILQFPEADAHTSISYPHIPFKEAQKLIAKSQEIGRALKILEKGSAEYKEKNEELKDIERYLNSKGAPPMVSINPTVGDLSADSFIKLNKAMTNQSFAVFYTTKRLLSRLPPSIKKATANTTVSAFSSALSQNEVSLTEFAYWFRVISERYIGRAELNNTLKIELEKAISVFLDGFSDLQLHLDVSPPRFSIQKSGKRMYLEQLSDGERGLLALVFDLVRRLSQANPASNNPIAEGQALVLIDEIELHLHPKWQRQVIRHLREVFKSCQFIITTHSPQVIGQVKAEKLRLLKKDDSERVVQVPIAQSFGMDSGWILQNIMGVSARDYDTEQKLSAIYDAIDDDQYKDARILVETLRSEIGDFPDLQEVAALLDRLEMLVDDEEN
jgi:predicted ATP-binding protein involved in virulence